MAGSIKIAGTTLATNPTNSKVEIDDAVSGKGIAKAWVNFNGTLSMTVGSSYGPNAPPADYSTPNPIRAAFNVDYVIDRGSGDYEVHYENAMADTNYCASAWAGGGSGGAAACCVIHDNNLQPSSLRLQTRDLNVSAAHNTNNMYESSIVMISVFR